MASGKRTVQIALVANSIIGVVKFIAYASSGSAAMLSEGIHSVADVLNQGLLLLGIKRSEASANERFKYGYGAERYFWALISAVGIFFLGCGVTVYHGIHAIIDGHPAGAGAWDYGVLILGLILEGGALAMAVKGINADRGDTPFMKFLSTSDDPTAIAVLLEDSVACLGLLVAFAGILLSNALDSSVPDGVASIIIGLLLGLVAVFLIAKNHSLIIGKSVNQSIEQAAKDILAKRSSVERILDFKSRVLSAEHFRLKVEVEFDGAVLADRLLEKRELAELHAEATASPEALRALMRTFANDVVDELGDEVDRIEAELREALPGVQHIDIEAD